MSRESLIVISRLIVAAVFIASLLAMALGEFFITLIAISGGLIIWLLYLLAAGLGTPQGESGTEATLGKALSKVVAGLGGVLAVSAFKTYGIEQTIWGGYAFDVMGLALALAVLWVTLMPLVVLQLLSKPLRQAQGGPVVLPAWGREKQAPALPEGAQPPTATKIPEEQLYYSTPYPQEPEAYDEEGYIEYDEEGEEWAGEEEEEEEDYEDEEGYEAEDEEDDDEEEDVR